MRLSNDTSYEARLLRSETPSERMMAALIVRVAYRVDEQGALTRLSAEETPPWAQLRDDAVLAPEGSFEPDPTLPRTGTDVMLVGEVDGGGQSSLQLRLEVGPYRVGLTISGKRRWERGLAGDLWPTPPEPIERLTLAPEVAFGGAAAGRYGPLPYPNNPRGRGYYHAAKEALGAPLASVEWSGEEVQAWDQRPEPAVVGPYPQAWWSRLQQVWVRDPESQSLRLRPDGGPFDQAHPRLSGRDVPVGAAIELQGIGAPLRARIPRCPAAVTWILGDARCPRELQVDELIVDPGRRLLAVAWRKSVHYEYVRHQDRRAIVEERPA